MGELAQFIHDNVASTGVYIGELEHPFQPIEDNADESAHISADPAVIKFKFANEDHKELMVGENLEPGKGVTHDVFADAFTD